MEYSAYDWCFHYETAVGDRPTLAEFSRLLGREFCDAEIFYINVYSRVKMCSPHIVTLDRLREKFGNCYEISIYERYLGELHAIVKLK